MTKRKTPAGLVMTTLVAAGCSADPLPPNAGTGGNDVPAGAGMAGMFGGTGGLATGTGGAGVSAGTSGTMGGVASGGSVVGGASAGTSSAGVGGVPNDGGRMGVAGAGGAESGRGGSGAAGQAGSAAAPTFTDIWNQTLESGCAVPYCHDGSGKGWSGFDKATAYRTLVGFASTTCLGETRVVAGNPEASVLAAAISHADLGDCNVPTMPRDRPKLRQADIDRIVAWIRAGARND